MAQRNDFRGIFLVSQEPWSNIGSRAIMQIRNWRAVSRTPHLTKQHLRESLFLISKLCTTVNNLHLKSPHAQLLSNVMLWKSQSFYICIFVFPLVGNIKYELIFDTISKCPKDLVQIHNTFHCPGIFPNNFQKMNSIEKVTNGWGDFYLFPHLGNKVSSICLVSPQIIFRQVSL